VRVPKTGYGLPLTRWAGMPDITVSLRVMSQRRVHGRVTYGDITAPHTWAKGYYDLLQDGHNIAQRLQHGRSV
jgi:hypothetical protein